MLAPGHDPQIKVLVQGVPGERLGEIEKAVEAVSLPLQSLRLLSGRAGRELRVPPVEYPGRWGMLGVRGFDEPGVIVGPAGMYHALVLGEPSIFGTRPDGNDLTTASDDLRGDGRGQTGGAGKDDPRGVGFGRSRWVGGEGVPGLLPGRQIKPVAGVSALRGGDGPREAGRKPGLGRVSGRQSPLNHVPLSLEGVRWQGNTAAIARAVPARPIDGCSSDPQTPQRVQEKFTVRAGIVTGSERRKDEAVRCCRAGWMLCHHAAERLAGTNFQKHTGSAMVERLDSVPELHRLVQVSHPVRWIGGLGVLDPCAGHIGRIRNARRAEVDRSHRVEKCIPDSLHHGGVKGVSNRQLLARDPRCTKVVAQTRDCRRRSADHRHGRTIDDRDRQLIVEDPPQRFTSKRNGEECTERQLIDEKRPSTEQNERVFQGEDAGEVGRHVFTGAIAHHTHRL